MSVVDSITQDAISALEKEGFKVTVSKWSSWHNSGINIVLMKGAFLSHKMNVMDIRNFYRGYFMGKQ